MTKRNVDIRLRVSEEENKIIESKADKLGLSVSAFLRMLALHSEAELEVD